MAKKYSLKLADSVRNKETKAEQKRIQKLYQSAADDIAKQLEKYSKQENATAALKTTQLKSLQQQVNKELDSITLSIEGSLKKSMSSVSKEVVAVSTKVFKENIEGTSKELATLATKSLNNLQSESVEAVATGKLYKNGQGISDIIWGDNKAIKKEINEMIAKGITLQKSAYDIAKDLEKYVSPTSRKEWDWSKVYPNSRKKIDYNAQRLARTSITHTFQDAAVRSTKNNPFIESYTWLSSNSDRVCPLCQARNGQVFKKNELPLDHPNGMCTFVYNVPKDLNEIAKELGEYYKNSEDEDYDNLDDFLKGYNVYKKSNASKSKTVSSEVSKTLKNKTSKKLASEVAETIKENIPDVETWDDVWDEVANGETYRFYEKVNKELYDYFETLKLTQKQKDAITDYTGGHYYNVNKYLRVDKKLSDMGLSRYDNPSAVKKIADRIITQLDKAVTNGAGRDIVVKRGVSGEGLKGLTGMELKEVTKEKLDNLVGKVLTDKGYMSTSYGRIPSGFNGGCEMEIYVPKDAKCLLVQPLSEFADEKEVLLNRGSNLLVEKVEQTEKKGVKLFLRLLIDK